MPTPNESQVGTYLDQAEFEAGDVTMIENVFQGYSVISGGGVTAQGSPDGTVAVATGKAKVGNAVVTITAGNVFVISGSANPDGTTPLAADAALARFSLITINSSGQLGVLHGTGAGLGPNNDGSYLSVFPTFAGKTVLASVWVPPTATTVSSGQIVDKREIHTDGDFIARVITPTALSANVNDYAPTGLTTANTIRQGTSDTTQRTVSGMVPTGWTDGRVGYLHNLGPGPLALLDESTSSSAANRFGMADNVILPVDRGIGFYYDVTSSRWRVVGGQSGGTTPAIALDSTPAAGSSPRFLRNDDTIQAFDATVPVTQAFSDAAATGSVAFAARRDHKHGMPASPSGLLASLTAATGAIANTETVIISASIPANSLAAGDTFILKAQGTGNVPASSPGTGTFRLRFNPVTLTGTSVSIVQVVAASGTRTTKPWAMEFIVDVWTIGATGTLMGEGSATSAPSSSDLFAPMMSVTTSPLTVDTTATNLLELTFQSGAAATNITAYTAYIRKV